MRSKAEEQRAEGQLRRLIGDAAYTDWEETRRIGIRSKAFQGYWTIERRGWPGYIQVSLTGPSWAEFGGVKYHCVGAAWGFKGSIPVADQVIALCLWIHADEQAILDRAFPEVDLALRGKKRAEDWDAIIREATGE